MVGLLNRENILKREGLTAHLPPLHAAGNSLTRRKKTKNKKHKARPKRGQEQQTIRRAPRDSSTCLGATQVSVRLVPVQDSLGSSTINRPIGVASQTLRFRVRSQLSQSRCLSLRLTMSTRVFLFLPPRGHQPPPTLRDRLNPHPCLQRRRFPVPRYAKHPDAALYAIGPLFLLQTLGRPSVRNRSTISPSHPVLSALRPQGFRTRFALTTAGRSFG